MVYLRAKEEMAGSASSEKKHAITCKNDSHTLSILQYCGLASERLVNLLLFQVSMLARAA